MNRKARNLQQLWHRFDTNTNVSTALDEVRAQAGHAGTWDLAELLRHHSEEPIEDDDEISMRDAFDDLLAFWGCVEIAAIVGFVPEPLPKAFKAAAVQTLCNPHVRRYYRRHYPLLLPDMLLARIGSLHAARERARDKARPLFLEFLQISGALEEDSGIEMLLWFLDDGVHQGYGWEDCLAILRRPKRLIAALKRSPGRQNPAELAADGLRKFLGFCVSLDDLLRRSRKFPLFQAAAWHYHGYWFRIIRGEIRGALDHALLALQGWSTSPTADGLSTSERAFLRAESKRSLLQLRQVVHRLTGKSYGGILSRVERQVRRDSARAAACLHSP